MAENDIELSVGLKLDENQFLNSYSSWLSKTTAETQKQVGGILDDTKGSATKQWGPLPYYTMHDNSAGARAATMAFLPSLGRDLNAAGFASDSIGYQSAMINAAYRSSMADPMQRFHRMYANGLIQQADLTHPDTTLGRTIETDYALMSQPWSRDFIREVHGEALDAEVLGKSKVAKSKESSLEFDFAGMREYAVDAGLGRWVDEDKGNTADNFEFVNDELEKIEDKSDKIKKDFLDWHDVLKGVLGTITAIGATTIAVGTAAVQVTNKAEKGTVDAGSTLDRRRAFINMTAYQELMTKVASKSVGLGEDAIRDEIYKMSENREKYKMYGEGDMLPQALLNVYSNIMSSDAPYEVYLQSADELYDWLKTLSPEQREPWLMNLQKAGLGNMASVVGSFLSNDSFASTMGYKPSNLFALATNPYYGVYEDAESMLPGLARLNLSIETSMKTLQTAWTEEFGKPFKSWWDSFLQEDIVPWGSKLMEVWGAKFRKFLGTETTEDEAKILATELPKKVTQYQLARNWQLANMGAGQLKVFEAALVDQEDALAAVTGNHSDKNVSLFPEEPFNFKNKQAGVGKTWKNILNYYNSWESSLEQARSKAWKYGAKGDKDKAAEWEATAKDTWDTGRKVKYMVDRLKELKLDKLLEDNMYESVDQYLLRAMQLGDQTPFDDFKNAFEESIETLLSVADPDKDMAEQLKIIAENTEALKILREDPKAVQALQSAWGAAKTAQFLGYDAAIGRE